MIIFLSPSFLPSLYFSRYQMKNAFSYGADYVFMCTRKCFKGRICLPSLKHSRKNCLRIPNLLELCGCRWLNHSLNWFTQWERLCYKVMGCGPRNRKVARCRIWTATSTVFHLFHVVPSLAAVYFLHSAHILAPSSNQVWYIMAESSSGLWATLDILNQSLWRMAWESEF